MAVRLSSWRALAAALDEADLAFDAFGRELDRPRRLGAMPIAEPKNIGTGITSLSTTSRVSRWARPTRASSTFRAWTCSI
jgi:hypothetical protein